MATLVLPTALYGSDDAVSEAMRFLVNSGIDTHCWHTGFAEISDSTTTLEHDLILLEDSDDRFDPQDAWRLYWLNKIVTNNSQLIQDSQRQNLLAFMTDGLHYPWFALAILRYLREFPFTQIVFGEDQHFKRLVLDRFVSHFMELHSVRYLFAGRCSGQAVPFYDSLQYYPSGYVDLSIWHPLYYLIEHCECAPVSMSRIIRYQRNIDSFDMVKMLRRAKLLN